VRSYIYIYVVGDVGWTLHVCKALLETLLTVFGVHLRFTQLHWRDLTVCNEQYFVLKCASVKIDQGRPITKCGFNSLVRVH